MSHLLCNHYVPSGLFSAICFPSYAFFCNHFISLFWRRGRFISSFVSALLSVLCFSRFIFFPMLLSFRFIFIFLFFQKMSTPSMSASPVTCAYGIHEPFVMSCGVLDALDEPLTNEPTGCAVDKQTGRPQFLLLQEGVAECGVDYGSRVSFPGYQMQPRQTSGRFDLWVCTRLPHWNDYRDVVCALPSDRLSDAGRSCRKWWTENFEERIQDDFNGWAIPLQCRARVRGRRWTRAEWTATVRETNRALGRSDCRTGGRNQVVANDEHVHCDRPHGPLVLSVTKAVLVYTVVFDI